MCLCVLVCMNFKDEIMLRGKECKTWEKNSNFLKNGKTVISVGNKKLSRSWMMKRTSPLIRLAKSSYPVEFRWIPR